MIIMYPKIKIKIYNKLCALYKIKIIMFRMYQKIKIKKY